MKAVFTKLVNFKASPAQHEAWQDAAYQRRMSFGRWAREQLDRGLSSSTAEPRLVEPEGAGATPVSAPKGNIESLARELVQRAKVTGKKCDRRLPKGAFCKSCGRIHG